jgi:GNAT superfamily N-acetyltransferase
VSSAGDIEIKVSAHGRWVRVFAETEGRDVSRLSYAPQPLRLGGSGEISMAGIAGVGTEPEYRQLGLARRVYQRAMEEIRAAGYSSVGLFTGTGIVAHRLYRRFGFVDTAIPTVAVKLLDPGECARRRVARLLEDRALADWRCTLGVELPPHAPVFVRVESAQADLLPAAPARVDLTLTMTSATFLRLFEAEADVAVAEASREVQWRGAREHWETLCRALSARRPVVWEG